MQLQPEFLQNIYSAFGREQTDAWIASLLRLLEDAASRWDLRLGAALPALSYNYVCSATRPSTSLRSAQDAVLKIGIPNSELTSEMETLRLWNNLPNCSTARLLESDPTNGLLLLERLRPGENLASLGGVAILIEMTRREFAFHTGTMLLGMLAWFAGNLLWLLGWQIFQVVFFWQAFLVLSAILQFLAGLMFVINSWERVKEK